LRKPQGCDLTEALFNFDSDCTPSGIAVGNKRCAAAAERVENDGVFRGITIEKFRNCPKRLLVCVKLRRYVVLFKDIADRALRFGRMAFASKYPHSIWARVKYPRP
jgi:hypothetical protein